MTNGDPPALEIGQAYAMRAWIMWLQSQITNAQPDLERQIGEHQREIERLRATMDRSGSVLKSLRATVEQLDDILRNIHDTDIMAASVRLTSSTPQRGTQQRPLAGTTNAPGGDAGVPGDDARARN